MRFKPLVLFAFVAVGVTISCGKSLPSPEQPSSSESLSKLLGQPVNLINSSAAIIGATNHPWQKFVEFLRFDNTDREAYASERGSIHFAEMLHNRAEYYGFKTAIVVVEFENGKFRALNAFDTVDYGLVYVDSTNLVLFRRPAPDGITFPGGLHHFGLSSFWFPLVAQSDKVAYIAVGKTMGFISIGFTDGFEYERFERSRRELAAFYYELDTVKEDALDFERKFAQLPSSIQYWIQNEYIRAIVPTLSERKVEPPSTWDRDDALKLAEEYWRIKTKFGWLAELWRSEVSGYNWSESESPVKSVKVLW